MDLVQVGVDHHRAPIDLRERMAIPGDDLPRVLTTLAAEPFLSEILVVSTCNRTEAYAATADPDAPSLLIAALRRVQPTAPAEDDGAWVRRAGEHAAMHLFRVCAGLDSAVLGETEIAHQVREAHRRALDAKAAGAVLDRLTSLALKGGKRARTDTALSRGAISHGQAAYDVTRRVFGDLKGRTVLVVGAGEMATRAATALSGLPGGRYVVANRTLTSAEVLAKTLPEGRAAGLDAATPLLAEAAVAVFAGGGEPLSRAACEAVVARRREPLVVFDYGVPRLADAGVGEIAGVFLYDLENLEQMLAKSLASRREAVPAAEAILAEEFDGFRAWHRSRAAVPAIRSLQAWAEEIRRGELAHLPPDLAPTVRDAVENVTRRIVDRILRRPTARVRQGAEEGNPALPTPASLTHLFGLDEPAADDVGGRRAPARTPTEGSTEDAT